MTYKAVFFDRDGTLTCANPDKIRWRDQTIQGWSNHKFEISYEKTMSLYGKAGYPTGGLKSIDEEKDFFRRYYQELLIGEGITADINESAELLFSELWCNNNRILYPEVMDVLEFFKAKGFKIGVISDTSPSLQITLEQLGLGKYIHSYTCSDLIGVMKPDPIIFNAALETLEVQANESMYVDDYVVEADGARDLGFLSFHLDRTGENKGEWVIKSLIDMINHLAK